LATSLALTPANVVETPWLEPRCASMVVAVAKAHTMTTTDSVGDGPALVTATSVAVSLDLLSGSA
jgi:hypothetical protein